MKERSSFTLDAKTISALNKLAKNGRFRNKSHAVEEAIKRLEEELFNEK